MSVRTVEPSPARPELPSSPTSRWQAMMACCIAAGLSIIVGSYSHHSASHTTTLELDAEVERGTAMLVFADRETWDAPSIVPLQPGKRTTYSVAMLPAHLSSLRIDPTDVADSRVRLCRLRLLLDGRALFDFGPAELRQFGYSQLVPASPGSVGGGPCLDLVSSGSDPILRIPEATLTGGRSRLQRLLAQWREYLWLSLALPCALFVLARARAWGPILLVPLGLLGLIPLQGLIWDRQVVRQLLAGYQSSDVAVGYANYSGYPKLTEHRVVLLACLLTAGIGFVFAGYARRRWPDDGWAEQGTPPADSQGSSRAIGVLLLVILLALNLGVRIPDVPAILHSITHDPHSTNYDQMNYFTWGYAYVAGWLPLRDFWYPYADFIRHSVPTAASFAGALFHVCLTWLVIVRAAFLLSGRSYLLVSGLLGLVAAASVTGCLAAESRYNLALGLVLLGVVSRQRAWRLRDGLYLAAYAGYALPYEAHQVLYAGVALAGLWLLDLVRPPDGVSRRQLGLWLVTVAAVVAFFAAVWALDLARQGRLGGQLAFLLHTAGMVSYASLTSWVWDWFGWPTTREAVLLYGVLLCLGLGGFLRLWARRGALADLGALTLACGILAALTLHKQVVRPHVAVQLLPFVAVPMFFWLAALLRAAPGRVERLALLCLVLVSLTAAVGVAPWRLAGEVAVYRFARVPAGIAQLADRSATEAARQRYYHAADMYPALQPLLSRLKQLLGADSGKPEARPAFLVFGDDSYVYAAMHQKPAPYISFYDTSPLSAQRQMVDWLNATRPPYVIWRPGYALFDLVPHVVRVPRLFAAVVADYELLETIGDFHLLRRRTDGKPADLAYFRSTLGETLDLGALPAYSRLLKQPLCTHSTAALAAAKAAPGCAPVLQVHVEQPAAEQALRLQLTVGAGRFSVSLLQRAGVQDYAVNLSSLWFWPSLPADLRESASAWSAPTGTTIQIRYRVGAENILF